MKSLSHFSFFSNLWVVLHCPIILNVAIKKTDVRRIFIHLQVNFIFFQLPKGLLLFTNLINLLEYASAWLMSCALLIYRLIIFKKNAYITFISFSFLLCEFHLHVN